MTAESVRRNVLAASVLAAVGAIACLGSADSMAGPSSAGGAPQTCGTVDVRGPNPPADTGAQQVEQCFLGAYSRCQPATLTLVNHGVDVISTTTFTISAPGCTVAGTTETTFVPSRKIVSSFTCTRLTTKNAGLLFVGCGTAGDIFVPPPAQ